MRASSPQSPRLHLWSGARGVAAALLFCCAVPALAVSPGWAEFAGRVAVGPDSLALSDCSGAVASAEVKNTCEARRAATGRWRRTWRVLAAGALTLTRRA